MSTLSNLPLPAIQASWLEPLASAYRRWGHLNAPLDGLGRVPRVVHPDLADAREGADPAELARLEAAYCGPLAADFMHVEPREPAQWLAARLESEIAALEPQRTLRRLAQAELFERFMQKRYVGAKRYSIEGNAGLVTLLDALLDTAIEGGAEVGLLGMSHRGRLTVMTTTVGVNPADLFADMEDVDPKSVLGSGDVKYHLGATGQHQHPDGRNLQVHLVSNPSHLEAVNPVMFGRARARQRRLDFHAQHRVVPICLHGDAAFAGQGITAETLNMAGLPGYDVGGTVHVVVNNLIGFTAEPPSLHTSRFSSDLAKRLPIPILRVNGEDADAIARAGRLAMEYRQEFRTDVVIDLIGYRRYGHSEVEDPTTTSPLLYERIGGRPLLYQVYAEQLGTDAASLHELETSINESLASAQEDGRSREERPVLRTLPSYWHAYEGGQWHPDVEVDTAVDADRLAQLGQTITEVPEGFSLHRKLTKVMDQRRAMAMGEKPVDFATAEALAFASLLSGGVGIRFSGQDIRRGTFNHRHAVLRDTETAEEYLPLSATLQKDAFLDICDSPLSEAAVLGYEYGFSRDYPDALVIWEAQFGDFANGAQIIFDQFLAAAEDKWDLLSGLVVMLPHGYEGQGPEHSSARLERFLQLAAEHNHQVCQPSVASETFHLLRRQVLSPWRKPLILFTPKGLLRAPIAASPLSEFTQGRFEPVRVDGTDQPAERYLICSGKVAHALAAEREKRAATTTHIVCVTQLYPFPEPQVAEILGRAPDARLVWVQEEPSNMGALEYVKPRLQRLAGGRHVTTVKRSRSASPATGSAAAHRLEHETLMDLAFR